MTPREIFLTKCSRIAVGDPSVEPAGTAMAATFNRNLESLGFSLSRELFETIAAAASTEVFAIYKQTIPVLRKMVGAHRQFDPMYPNFPDQVMQASDLELYVNAIAHYWGAAVGDVIGVPIRLLPSYQKDERAPLDEKVDLKVIHLGTRQEFDAIFARLVGSNGSLSEGDKEIVAWFCANRAAELPGLMPQAIPQKETVALLAGRLSAEKADIAFLAPYVKTATDVLRIAVVMSGGDVSLAAATKFRKWNRRERRFFLTTLEGCPALTEDMLRWGERWKRLGHALHPFEQRGRFPKTCEALDVVFGDKPFPTFDSRVEAGFARGDVASIVPLLGQRPGAFARRLDQALRASGDQGEHVSRSFLDVARGVSTPVLLQVYNHFKHRQTHRPRAFFPKGNTAKVQLSQKPLPPLSEELARAVADGVRAALVGRFSTLPPLGNVFVDESLRQAVVPFAQRSASKSLRTLTRGTRVDLPAAPTVRFFLWWKDGAGRTDIDLSAVFHDVSWSRLGDVSYYDLRNSGCCHSGDITSAPHGACEFIDMDLETLSQNGVRYVSMCLYSYTKQPYCDLPECFAGWMSRSGPQSGEVFDARTVQDKVDLTANAVVAIPAILDVAERKMIWADISLTNRGAINNSRTNSDGVARMGKAIAGLDLGKPNLFDLFSMHAEARGVPAPREAADHVFSLHEGITPFDIDVVMNEFMADESPKIQAAS